MLPLDQHPIYAKALAKRESLRLQIAGHQRELEQLDEFVAHYERLSEIHEPERREAEGAPDPDVEADQQHKRAPAAETAATYSEPDATPAGPVVGNGSGVTAGETAPELEERREGIPRPVASPQGLAPPAETAANKIELGEAPPPLLRRNPDNSLPPKHQEAAE